MIESIEGKKGLPRHRPPFIAEKGLFGRPTLNHNVETLHWVRDIVEKGPDWWKSHGQDPRKKLVIFSDGLEVDRIESLYHRFQGRVRLSFGWGTLLTNDFRGLAPGDALAPFSLVCKAVSANGRPTVKLSDNPAKAVGAADEVARYKRVFGVSEQAAEPLLV